MPIETAQKIGKRFLAGQETANTYNNQLAYEALLLLSDHIPEVKKQCEEVVAENNIAVDQINHWRNQQFHDLAYAWFEHRGLLGAYLASHIQSTDDWLAEAPRRKDGSIIHKCKHDPAGSLLDMLQAYCIRLARAAKLTGDRHYIDELIHQFRIHELTLRDKNTGCYHQGQGWLADDALSPGTWSRGQGWLLHGMAHCLLLMDAWPEEQQELLDFTIALLNTLTGLQDDDGFWHQLVDQPEESFPDTSGTALILEAYVLVSAFMIDDTYQHVIKNAWNALKSMVDADGVVDQACKGPGPIWETEPWRNSKAPKGDPHGVFSTLFACAALIKHPQFLD